MFLILPRPAQYPHAGALRPGLAEVGQGLGEGKLCSRRGVGRPRGAGLSRLAASGWAAGPGLGLPAAAEMQMPPFYLSLPVYVVSSPKFG